LVWVHPHPKAKRRRSIGSSWAKHRAKTKTAKASRLWAKLASCSTTCWVEGGGVYIANVLKCRPPGNRNPKPEEVAQCLPYLERQVALLKPKMILAMGRFAVQALLRDSVPELEGTPYGKLRGRVYQYQGVPVVVTYHPNYVLRNLPEKAKVWADLCLAMAHLKGSE
jgi:uracil-DNA glycosylase